MVRLFEEGLGFGSGFREGVWYGDGFAALSLAFVGSFHERHDLEGMIEADGGCAGAEEAADGAAEGFVADDFAA
jgi:hypothetical protein